MHSTQTSSPATAASRTMKGRAIYRGIPLQATKGKSRFTLEQIKAAVEAAVSKNADALAGRTKA